MRSPATRSAPLLPAGSPRIVGIVNITADSFSDGGRYLGHAAALAHARRLRADGADVVPGSRRNAEFCAEQSNRLFQRSHKFDMGKIRRHGSWWCRRPVRRRKRANDHRHDQRRLGEPSGGGLRRRSG